MEEIRSKKYQRVETPEVVLQVHGERMSGEEEDGIGGWCEE